MKNSILSSIKEGKIRKNAKAKISALLEAATCITLIEKKSNVDDSYTDFDSTLDKAGFWAWYDKNYTDLVILVSADNGVITRVKFMDCQYYFANRIVLTFNEVEAVEPEAVVETEVKTIAIDTIKIIFSELNLFNSGDVLTLAEYDALANTKALEVGFNAGYVKVEIEIIQLNTNRLKIRHDISAANPTLTYTLTKRGYNVTSAIVNVKPTVMYSQVKEALDQGYSSPLNHNQKLAEAVEVINSNIETNVIDMFTAKAIKEIDNTSHAIGFNSFSEIINYSQNSETNIKT